MPAAPSFVQQGVVMTVFQVLIILFWIIMAGVCAKLMFGC